MLIGIAAYGGVDLLDVAGPYEMFGWLSTYGVPAEVRVLAESPDEIATRDGFRLLPHAVFADTPQLDLLWVPGGDPKVLARLMSGPDTAYLDFLRKQSGAARYVASVCEGALLLAQAGLLDGYRATTHWAFVPCLKRFPRIEVAEGHPRFVVDRDRITGGGISSGLDEALELIRLLAGRDVAEQVQQVTQYYPKPPVHGTIPPATDCPFSW
jgi:transcriptional regulator GlxA family with amidase domain